MVRGITLILWPPPNVKPAKLEEWQDHWLFAEFGEGKKPQYQYAHPNDAYSGTGLVIARPITLEFPKIDSYPFKYTILAQDWKPIEGSFVVKRVR